MANRNVYDMDKQKVALVLSMGGARGIAHIGVIEELLRHNFEITSIAGSSMGAMAGQTWGEKLNYDLCINTSGANIEDLVKVIAKLVK